MRGKFKEKATKMIMVGYAENHARDVYRMYNPYSGKIVETRDIHAWADLTKAENDIRLTMAEAFDRQMVLGEDLEEVEAELAADEEELTPQIHLIPEYDEEIATMTALQPAETPMSSAGRIESMIEQERTKEDEVHDENETKMDVPPTSILFDSDSDDDEDVIILRKEGDSVEERIVELPTEQTIIENAEEMVEREQKQRTTPLERELKKLGIESPVVIENDEPGTRTRSRTRIAHLVFNTMLTSDPGEPKTFRAAVTGPKKQEWIPSAKSEINNFISRDAWKKFPRDKLNGRKPIPVKWIFKIKEEQDGTLRYKSRIVLKGYVMVPGVDYTESFSPVATDTTVRLAITIALYRQDEGWTIEMIDIEAAFLNAELEDDKPVFAEWPEGIVELGYITEDELRRYCIMLTRPMYGGVDVPRLFMKTLRKYLTKHMNMIQSLVDPCMYYWKDTKGRMTLMAVVHVDDVILVGSKKAIEEFKTKLKERFNISDLGKLKKHLGVWYDWSVDENGNVIIIAKMNKLEDEIVETYEKITGKEVKTYDTPGYPNKYLSKNEGPTVNMTDYRSMVGKIMYLTTKLAPDLANAARELAQHLSNPGEDHWKALDRMVGHIKLRPYEGLTYRRPKELRPISMVDSDYAKNTDNRKSISSGLHTLGGTLVHWESKTQHVVTLSSTEAEYISLARGACENKFIMMLLDEGIRRPDEKRHMGKVYEDNLGAIYLVKNQHVGARTKHIDVRAHFIRELEDNGYLNVQFIRSEENAADILNKNCPEKLHTKHAKNIRDGTLDCWREDVEDSRLLDKSSTGETVNTVVGEAERDFDVRTECQIRVRRELGIEHTTELG
ncbi:GAG-pre-integrase domain [Fragilaria crotonensis]|nr:GAG-pre-integrase domain [Fragilaria crotonensis]